MAGTWACKAGTAGRRLMWRPLQTPINCGFPNLQMVTLPTTVTLTGTSGFEPQFIKYDDSDSERNNIIYLLCDVSQS
jgi:hypothetical protein